MKCVSPLWPVDAEPAPVHFGADGLAVGVRTVIRRCHGWRRFRCRPGPSCRRERHERARAGRPHVDVPPLLIDDRRGPPLRRGPVRSRRRSGRPVDPPVPPAPPGRSPVGPVGPLGGGAIGPLPVSFVGVEVGLRGRAGPGGRGDGHFHRAGSWAGELRPLRRRRRYDVAGRAEVHGAGAPEVLARDGHRFPARDAPGGRRRATPRWGARRTRPGSPRAPDSFAAYRAAQYSPRRRGRQVTETRGGGIGVAERVGGRVAPEFRGNPSSSTIPRRSASTGPGIRLSRRPDRFPPGGCCRRPRMGGADLGGPRAEDDLGAGAAPESLKATSSAQYSLPGPIRRPPRPRRGLPRRRSRAGWGRGVGGKLGAAEPDHQVQPADSRADPSSVRAGPPTRAVPRTSGSRRPVRDRNSVCFPPGSTSPRITSSSPGADLRRSRSPTAWRPERRAQRGARGQAGARSDLRRGDPSAFSLAIHCNPVPEATHSVARGRPFVRCRYPRLPFWGWEAGYSEDGASGCSRSR